MEIKRILTTLGQISNIADFKKFISDDKITDEMIHNLERVTLVTGAGRFDFETLVSAYGSGASEMVDNPEPFLYDIVAADIYKKPFIHFVAKNAQFPGANNSTIDAWTDSPIFSKYQTLVGPNAEDLLSVVEHPTKDARGYKYVLTTYRAGGINPRYLAPTQDWAHSFATTVREFGTDGARIYFTGTAKRTGTFHGIRYSEEMGGETANTRVAVYTINDKSLGSQTIQFYMDAAKEKLADTFYAGKNAATLWDRLPDIPQHDPANGQIEMHGNGYVAQVGGTSVKYVNRVSLDAVISSIRLRQALSGNDNGYESHYTAVCGTSSYDILTSEAKIAFPVAQTVDKMTDKFYAGIGYAGVILADGTKITFKLDSSLDKDITQLAKSPSGFTAGSYSVHIFNTGTTKNGKSAIINKKVTSFNDLFAETPGVRGISRKANALGKGYNLTTSQKDSSKISAMAQWASVLADPYGYTSIKLNVR